MAAYATLQQLKDELNVASDDTSRDDFYTGLLQRISDWIDTQVNRSFGSATETVTNELHLPKRGNPQQLLYARYPYSFVVWLNHQDIASVTTVQAREVRSDDWTTLTADQFEWTEEGRVDLFVPYRFSQITYTYNAGSSTVPADIVEATLQLAAARVVGQPGNSVASERIGDLSLTYRGPTAGDNAEAALATINRYRVPSV